MNRSVALVSLALALALALVLALLAGSASRREASRGAVRDLVIVSTTDTAVFAPVIADFRRLHPDIRVRYELMDAEPLYSLFMEEARAGRPLGDMLLSTSMDLQAKLVNDGYATPHESDNTAAAPQWAQWRNEAFGISFEPVVMVFNTDLMRGRPIPSSRSQLLADLRRDPAFWRGRVGTYDIARSGLGYLLASQDARLNSEAAVLIDAFGDVGVITSENSAALLDRLERGEMVMGYNLLGSYARRRIEEGAPLTIVYPQEYTLAISRTAVIPRNAANPADAQLFLDYLLSLRGQRVLTEQSQLNAVRAEIGGPYHDLGVRSTQIGLLKPIALGPGLLVYLDQRKRAAMIESWRSSLGRSEPPVDMSSG